ncbi:unnamed protein product [Vitrella brassicaformis CCMP3155]|uniref:Uncharacterized protein n=1 Tax=Vitrella brassicaformis (strain CCMP3155) TaxID=1169540 RepID=A0A0G4F516_VITBC|nr:unnamed protein product [Vitrella brassicaformis CCMP3155]|eukprot:CEM07037.1 unnamed protein product [Vitrella brassicaformis CCMP3155]
MAPPPGIDDSDNSGQEDDTLFPTTWIKGHRAFLRWLKGQVPKTQADAEEIAAVSATLSNYGKEAISVFHQVLDEGGRVAIITNGGKGWVAQCLVAVPWLADYLQEHGIVIYSARDRGTGRGVPMEPHGIAWKVLTFTEELARRPDVSRVFSVGDKAGDLFALDMATRYVRAFPGHAQRRFSMLKIKLQEDPDIATATEIGGLGLFMVKPPNTLISMWAGPWLESPAAIRPRLELLPYVYPPQDDRYEYTATPPLPSQPSTVQHLSLGSNKRGRSHGGGSDGGNQGSTDKADGRADQRTEDAAGIDRRLRFIFRCPFRHPATPMQVRRPSFSPAGQHRRHRAPRLQALSLVMLPLLLLRLLLVGRPAAAAAAGVDDPEGQESTGRAARGVMMAAMFESPSPAVPLRNVLEYESRRHDDDDEAEQPATAATAVLSHHAALQASTEGNTPTAPRSTPASAESSHAATSAAPASTTAPDAPAVAPELCHAASTTAPAAGGETSSNAAAAGEANNAPEGAPLLVCLYPC